jgi:type III secretion protein T
MTLHAQHTTDHDSITMNYEDLARYLTTVLLPIVIGIPRILATVSIVPMMASQAVPMMARVTFVLSLALFLYPLHDATVSTSTITPALWAFIFIKEVLIGLCVGFVCSIFIWVVEGIGSLIDTLVGNNNLFLFNPMLNQEAGPFSGLLGQFGGMLFIVYGGFVVLLQALFTSFVNWPALSFFPTWSKAALNFFITSTAEMLITSVQLVMPILTVLMLVDFGLGLLNRSASHLNAYSLSMPLKALVSVLFLMLTLVYIGDVQGPLRQLINISTAFLKIPL